MFASYIFRALNLPWIIRERRGINFKKKKKIKWIEKNGDDDDDDNAWTIESRESVWNKWLVATKNKYELQFIQFFFCVKSKHISVWITIHSTKWNFAVSQTAHFRTLFSQYYKSIMVHTIERCFQFYSFSFVMCYVNISSLYEIRFDTVRYAIRFECESIPFECYQTNTN